MSKFKLVQRTPIKFQIFNQAGDVVGSVCVSENEISDLLKHWAGDKQLSPSPKAQLSIGGMTFAKPKAMSRAAILRGCL
jgi:hypothetical protein